MKNLIWMMAFAVVSLIMGTALAQDAVAFFRIVSPTITVITAFTTGGTLVWSNAVAVGATGQIQRATTLLGPSNWVNFAGHTVTGNVMALRLFDPHPPSGMVLIPAGNNRGADPDFGAYSLTVSAFYMDSTLVSKAKWDEVYNWALANGYTFADAGSGKGTNYPVQQVSWHDCVKWCNARSEKEGRPVSYRVGGNVYRGVDDNSVTCATNIAGYRLPTDVEFQYAARGGLSNKRFPWSDTIDHTKANYRGFPTGYAYDTGYAGYDTRFSTAGTPYTSPVDTFAANGYGLSDMAGNVWEWCWDWYPGYEGSCRVLRGGCLTSYASDCRVGLRGLGVPAGAAVSDGFRTVLPPGQ